MRILCALGLVAAAFAFAGSAAADDDLRACTDAENASAKLAPMPKFLSSLEDVTSNSKRYAGYLLTIDTAGKPTVVCALDSFTDPKIRERAAEAVAEFEYWPDDATAPGALAYVHLQSQGYGMTMPSVLPRDTDPDCGTMIAKANAPMQPTSKPKFSWPAQLMRDGVGGTIDLVIEVRENGAAYLICRASGQNIDLIAPSAYYNAARFRWPAERGRAPFYYHIQYKLRA